MPTSRQCNVGNVGAGFRQEALPHARQCAFPGGLATGLHCKHFRAACSRTGRTRRHHWTVRGATQHVLRRDKPAGVTGHTGGNSGYVLRDQLSAPAGKILTNMLVPVGKD